MLIWPKSSLLGSCSRRTSCTLSLIRADSSSPPGGDLIILRVPNRGPNSLLDFEEPEWRFGRDSFDLIHAQRLCGSVSDWPSLLGNCYK